MKNVLIITTSLRNGSNSDILAEYFKKGAESSENKVEVVSLKPPGFSPTRAAPPTRTPTTVR